jgi:hypothetical protein
LVERPERKNHLEDLGVDGRIILRWTTRNEIRCIDWTNLDQDRHRSRELVDEVMKRLVLQHNMHGILDEFKNF